MLSNCLFFRDFEAGLLIKYVLTKKTECMFLCLVISPRSHTQSLRDEQVAYMWTCGEVVRKPHTVKKKAHLSVALLLSQQ